MTIVHLRRRLTFFLAPPWNTARQAGAKVATVLGHAGADTLNVRDILITEPHRVWFASRALLRGPLLRSCGQRRACERETEKRKGRDWSHIQCGANSHSG